MLKASVFVKTNTENNKGLSLLDHEIYYGVKSFIIQRPGQSVVYGQG